ncbi:MAG TPA: GxxExxY protein [Terriglobia bacterium]|jgi:GxxExxY protein
MDPGDQLAFRILKAARAVHTTLGPGFIESIYTRALIAELVDDGFQVEREKTVKIWYGDRLVGKHRLDLVVDGTVIIELKANHSLIPLHIAQMNSYLHATTFPFGLLLNFGATDLQWEFIRSGTGTPDNES